MTKKLLFDFSDQKKIKIFDFSQPIDARHALKYV